MRNRPTKNDLLLNIKNIKKLKLLLELYDVSFGTFKRWLKYFNIMHDFQKGKIDKSNSYWSKNPMPEEMKNKISMTKKLAPKKLKLNRKFVKCSICGREFETVPDAVSRSLNKMYCSIKCRNIAHGIKMKTGINKSKFNCLNCGREFYNYKSSNFNKFCCKKCFSEYTTGKTYDEIYGIEKSIDIKSKITKATMKNNKSMPKITKPHLIIKNEMIKRNLYDGFMTSQQLYYFEIDELNIEKKICLEIDGDYWHSLPKRIIQDKRKDTFLKNKGFTVIRIKEYDIYNNLDICIKKLENILC